MQHVLSSWVNTITSNIPMNQILTIRQSYYQETIYKETLRMCNHLSLRISVNWTMSLLILTYVESVLHYVTSTLAVAKNSLYPGTPTKKILIPVKHITIAQVTMHRIQCDQQPPVADLKCISARLPSSKPPWSIHRRLLVFFRP